MAKLITAFTLFIITFISAQGQQSVTPATPGLYEQGMGKAFGLWKENKSTEASDLFERIAAAEPNNWLPNYYVTGKKSRTFLDFKVDARFPGDTLPTVVSIVGSEGVGTGYQVRNMEYYFLGNRQDSFRGIGYPHNFDAEYDSILTNTYHIFEIGYYDESRDEPMKSKKQITIAIDNATDMNAMLVDVNKSLLARGIVVGDVT